MSLRELMHDRIDTRATPLILPCGAQVAYIVCMQVPISEKISYLALILCDYFYTLNGNTHCAIALNHFACDHDK